jgi:uncharacterized small protein (DUF1192 family)
MFDEEAAPRRARGATLGELAKEDLEVYAVDELQERIELLKAVIARTEARLEKKRSGRSAADGLFKL